jgi:hypothetical protein
MHKIKNDDFFIAGICGKAGSGKTTFANYLIQQFRELTDDQYMCTIIPFAKALKELAVEIGWNGIKDEKGRLLLQRLGTDVCRDCIDKNYWVKKWEQAVAKERAAGVKLVIADDVRFPNEIISIQDKGGSIWNLRGRGYELSDEAAKHESEKALFSKNKNSIWNGSTFLALECCAKTSIKEIIKWTY